MRTPLSTRRGPGLGRSHNHDHTGRWAVGNDINTGVSRKARAEARKALGIRGGKSCPTRYVVRHNGDDRYSIFVGLAPQQQGWSWVRFGIETRQGRKSWTKDSFSSLELRSVVKQLRAAGLVRDFTEIPRNW